MFPTPPNKSPLKWQQEAFQAARTGLKTWKRIIINSATGTGKGFLIAGIAQSAANKGKRVLVTTERIELVEDLAARIRLLGPVSIVSGKVKDWSAHIVVASAASLTAKNLSMAPAFDLLLLDECHHSTSPTHRRYIDHFDCPTIGMTATPYRSAPGGKTSGLGEVFQALVYEYSIQEAMAAGDLCGLRSYQVKTDIDLSAVRTVGDDWQQEDLGKVIDTPDRNRIVVEQYLSRCGARPTLVFAVTVEHAHHLTEAFQSAGIQAMAAWGAMKDRSAVIAGFRDGSIPVVVSVDLIREGFDAPNCAAILKARPTQSLLVFVQMLGRGLRRGKPDCLFIDLVDNGCRLDLSSIVDLSRTEPEHVREWKPGDLCVRRHHEDQGIGEVLSIVDAVGEVEWKSGRSKHPLRELARPKQDALDAPELITVEPRVRGIRSYEIFLLGGQKATEEIGFYEYYKTWTASGKSSRAAPAGLFAGTPFGSTEYDRWTVHICEKYEVWSLLNTEDPTKVGCFADKGEAIRFGQKWLSERKVKVEEREGPATHRQINALRGLGVTRPREGMGAAEAAILIEAKRASQAVRDHKLDSCACGGLFILSERLTWGCLKCGKKPTGGWKPPRVWKPLERKEGLLAKVARVVDRRETAIKMGYRKG